MSLVTHKYTPSEMSDEELLATFAARQNTVDFLIKALRDQIGRGTLSSYIITGPRGAGKSTIIQMVDLRIRQDSELSAAWMPVVFPEEQFNMISLRDMLAATLQILVKNGIQGAKRWLDRAEAEANEEQSQQLAITGLREITRQSGKRLVLFIENLNQLLEEHLNDHMKGTLRRLLMSDAFMMIIGSTVHVFETLKSYDEVFFNYFGQVPLSRLDAEQVSELLRKRAEFDQNERFLRELPKQQAKIKTLVHLTGGNPRFVLMLYELLSAQQITTIVQYLKRLVDELTPLLKDEMENLPPQQRKIIHALMEKGGTAQPTGLATATRLPLNAVTIQLKRLKDAQIVAVLGGGKGRAANYTVPDKLFSIWYQMRYLGQNRRRIELFVQILSIWYEIEERVQTLRQLAELAQKGTANVLRECATTAEYFAASLRGTPHENDATDLSIKSWLKTDLKEAALAFADFSAARSPNELGAQLEFVRWLTNHQNPQKATETLDQLLSESPPQETQAEAFILRGINKGQLGDINGAISDLTAGLNLTDPSTDKFVALLDYRGRYHEWNGNSEAAMADYDKAIKKKDVARVAHYFAHMHRGSLRIKSGDQQGALDDYNSVIGGSNAPSFLLARAFIGRGRVKAHLNDENAAISDYSKAIELSDISKDDLAAALGCRGLAKLKIEDNHGAVLDANRIIDMACVPPEELAKAYVCRGTVSIIKRDAENAIQDFSQFLRLNIANAELLSQAGKIVFTLLTLRDDKKRLEGWLEEYAGMLNRLAPEISRETVLRFLRSIVEPAQKHVWPIAWKILVARLSSETAESIRLFEPVSRVIEGQDRSIFDSLPPEHRDFALEVLAKFEAESDVEGEKRKAKVSQPQVPLKY